MKKFIPSTTFIVQVAVAMLIVVTVVSLLPDQGTVKTLYTPRVLLA